jgi:hypothetical protein
VRAFNIEYKLYIYKKKRERGMVKVIEIEHFLSLALASGVIRTRVPECVALYIVLEGILNPK